MQKVGYATLSHKKILVAAAVLMVSWTGILTVLSINGFFADFTKLPPRPALALLLPLPFVLLFSFSKTGTQIIQAVPPHWLILIQAFRILVELLLWLAFVKNMLPVQMTFEGRNFDVLTGIFALPVSYVVSKKSSPKAILVFNITGILLLLNILIIAVLSMPTPIRYFMNEPANILVAQFPFILLPGVLVPIAYSFHIFSLRKLFIKK